MIDVLVVSSALPGNEHNSEFIAHALYCHAARVALDQKIARNAKIYT